MNVKRLWYIKKKKKDQQLIFKQSPKFEPEERFWLHFHNPEQWVVFYSSIFIPLCFLVWSPSIQLSSLSLPLSLSQNRSGLLGKQKAEAFLHSHPVSGELVVGGEPGRVGRAGWLPIGTDLLLVTKKNSSVDFSAGKH